MPKQNLVLLEVDPQVAGAYELFLAARGFGVSVASSLSAALRAVASGDPQTIVVGNLPDSVETGTAASRLRALSSRPLSVIVMSPSMDEIEGVDLILPRGAHPRALLDAIRTATRRRPQTAPLATAS